MRKTARPQSQAPTHTHTLSLIDYMAHWADELSNFLVRVLHAERVWTTRWWGGCLAELQFLVSVSEFETHGNFPSISVCLDYLPHL